MSTQKIEFKKTSDPLISAGISGLIKFCEKRIEEKKDIHYKINENVLTIEANNLNLVLKEMYLDMGKEYYDISNNTSLSDKDSFYYDEQNKKVVQSKYRTYGFSYLINNSRQRTIGDKVKFDKLPRDVQDRLIKYFKSHNLEPEKHKEIYINGRNTTLPEYIELEISEGEQKCSVCGHSYKKTWESKSISPFLKGSSGGNNFVSKLKGTEKICWKCIYLLRFSPIYAFYQYSGSDINSFFFNSNSIEGLKRINNVILEKLFLLPDQLLEKNYMKNFYFYKFGQDEDKDYFNYPNEQLLLLLYTIFQQKEVVRPRMIEKNEWIRFEEILQYKTEVFYLKAKSFGGTLRPIKAETFRDFHYIFSVFNSLDKERINLQHLLWSLKLYDGDNRTILRNRWAEQLLHKLPTINTCEEIVWKNFMNKKYNRDFNQILNWLKYYESIINYGGNRHMNDETRSLAIKLGSQLGFAAKNDSNPKAGKGKLIMMRKARKISQFLDQIISFQVRYGISVNKEILSSINEVNFDYFRQFTIISALNTFNYKEKKNGN